ICHSSSQGSVTWTGHNDDGTVVPVSSTRDGAQTDLHSFPARRSSDLLEGTVSDTYGTITLNAATGEWEYVLDNSKPATQALKEGQTVTQTYTARVTDEFGAYAEQTITVTINGTNDVPVVTNTTADAQGAVSEAGHNDDGTAVPGTPTTGGTLTATDVDADAAQTWSLEGTVSDTYGTITLNAATGVWEYV